MEYTNTELRVLWYIKRHGPLIAKSDSPSASLIRLITDAVPMSRQTIANALRTLEDRCLILKTYKREKAASFDASNGFNPLIRIELVDPDMHLPPLPPPMPLGVVMAKETREMERTVEPSPEAIVEALINRITELQGQVNKLQDIVEQQATMLSKASEAKKANSTHLTSRIQGALTEAQWAALTTR